ncbi:response regulator [Pontiella sulfatireligans]|uniref:Transcriptional regulatory protein WalR n=1 Tax=Pontiella sulfatireligans TaxID=2750658 RepID=A0A6C2UQK6_9BACT|nr:response regulator [Pontiella sulfatireligans]VGO21286.1 Transcriptional regulatory protein WalR [Pontiella sulfatireligans]
MKKVFLIDDDVFVTNLYKNMLRGEGIEGVCINSGEEAIQRLSIEKPDLVVLDLHMPGINGVEVLRHIRGNKTLKDLYVIVLSSGYVKSLVEEVGDFKVQKFCAKLQCKPKQILTAIKDAIAELSAREVDGAGLDAAVQYLGDVPMADLHRYLTLMRTDARPEARRVCLVHIYKIMYEIFQSALAVDETFPRGKLSRALKVMLNDLFEHPDPVTEMTMNTLTQGLSKLNALCIEATEELESATALRDLLNDLK